MGQFNSSGILKNGKGKQRGYMRNKCDDREEEEMIEEQKEGNKKGRQGGRNKKTGARKEGGISMHYKRLESLHLSTLIY